jgi:NADPH-dependent 2,4-dienoyl-CoA reductase/sulfur reductase-like enzyme
MLIQRRFDVLIVGMGPAGIAASCAAAESGLRVGVVDDNPREGGQIWRGETGRPSSKLATAWLTRFHAARIETLRETRVIDSPSAGTLAAESADAAMELQYGKLILATGARERFLPFPGWTLPNVMGAGGLQALVKGGIPVEGKRIVVAGSGPLLLAVAAYLRKRGAVVALIAEQTGWVQLASFTLSLAPEPAKVFQALALQWALRGVPYITGCWPVQALGGDRLAAVELRTGRKKWREPCDYLACGFGLVPNLELPLLLGCDTRNGFVAVNEWQETSRSGIYCAGEPNGIGGVDLALIEGQIAGFAAAGIGDRARREFRTRARSLWLRPALDRAFALRDELRTIVTPDTIVCRCEDVPLERMQSHPSWRTAKLQTRCGMGPCQGRICGPAAEFLLGWKLESVRPPIFPVRLDHLAGPD